MFSYLLMRISLIKRIIVRDIYSKYYLCLIFLNTIEYIPSSRSLPFLVYPIISETQASGTFSCNSIESRCSVGSGGTASLEHLRTPTRYTNTINKTGIFIGGLGWSFIIKEKSVHTSKSSLIPDRIRHQAKFRSVRFQAVCFEICADQRKYRQE